MSFPGHAMIGGKMETFEIVFDGGSKGNPGRGYGSYVISHNGIPIVEGSSRSDSTWSGPFRPDRSPCCALGVLHLEPSSGDFPRIEALLQARLLLLLQ